MEQWGSQGEKRQLWAKDRRRPDDPPFYLAEGEGERYRQAGRRGELVCPDPQCASELIVRAGTKKRHHFAHRTEVEHESESLNHIISKQLFYDWLKGLYPSLKLEMEAVLENGRRADLLATSPKGTRMAFEFQYSAISKEEFDERHGDYAELGIIDVWLWGHTTPHCRRHADSDPGSCVLRTSDLLEHCYRETGSVLFINPTTKSLAHAFVSDQLREFQAIRRHHRVSPSHFVIPLMYPDNCMYEYSRSLVAVEFPLTDCSLGPSGLKSPGSKLVGQMAQMKHQMLEDQKLEAERRRQEEREEAERQAREEEDRAREEKRRQEWVQRQKDLQEERWQACQERLIKAFGAVPHAITAPTHGEDWVWGMHHGHWKTLIWERLQGKVGQVLSWETVARPVLESIPAKLKGEERYDRVKYTSMAINNYLRALEESGYLRLDRTEVSWGPDRINRIGVCADLSFVPKFSGRAPALVGDQVMAVNPETAEVLGPWAG